MILLQPKEQAITCQDGTQKTFILSKLPAIQGREILTQYPLTAMPKIGEYQANEALMLKLLSYVAVPRDGGEPLRLSTSDLVNNHVPDAEALMRIEAAMLEYNCSFFGSGKVSTFFELIAQKAQALITKTLTDSLARSSEKS